MKAEIPQDKSSKKIKRLLAQKARLDDQINRMKKRSKRKDIPYAYGNWATRCCLYPYENPQTYQEVLEDVNILRKFLDLPEVNTCFFKEEYFKPGYFFIVLGVEMKHIIESELIKCPHPSPDFKYELDDNVNFLREKYPCNVVFGSGYDYSIIASDHIYSVSELHLLKFPFNDFNVPEGEVSFTGRLVARMWAKRSPMLVCFFVADNGKCYSLNTWWKSEEKSYRPSPGCPSFKDEVLTGTIWECTVTITSSGKITWSKAILKK